MLLSAFKTSVLLANSVLVATVLEERRNISNLNVGTATGSCEDGEQLERKQGQQQWSSSCGAS